MANVQRYVANDKNVVPIQVASGVTVELGDLMFLDSANNLRSDGSSTASNYAYPIEYFRISGASVNINRSGVTLYFLGVAMDDVDGENNGVTKHISVATTGKFKFDLKPAKTVYPGDWVSASGTTTASNMFNQKVSKTTEIKYAMGFFAEKKLHALSAEVVIKSFFAGPTIG